MAEYISKQDVIDYLNGYLHSLGYGNTDLYVNGQRGALINAIQDILAVEAAEVQPIRHGRWVCNEELYYNGMTKCSCCNEEYYTEDIQNLQGDLRTVNYCPNCGARMDGDTNG